MVVQSPFVIAVSVEAGDMMTKFPADVMRCLNKNSFSILDWLVHRSANVLEGNFSHFQEEMKSSIVEN